MIEGYLSSIFSSFLGGQALPFSPESKLKCITHYTAQTLSPHSHLKQPSRNSPTSSPLFPCRSQTNIGSILGLDGALVVMRVDPDIETQAFEQVGKYGAADRECDWGCEKTGSTVVDGAGERVHEVEVLLRNSRYFLRNFDSKHMLSCWTWSGSLTLSWRQPIWVAVLGLDFFFFFSFFFV